MKKIKYEDVEEFALYVLKEEQRLYRENPIQSNEFKIKKQNDFVKKLDEIATKVARRENVNVEN